MPATCAGASGLTSALPSSISAPFVVSAPPPRTPVELLEEPPDLHPHVAPAGQPPPVRADHADERVAVLDRHDPVATRAERAIHQQALDVLLERAQQRVGRDQPLPRVELELG